MSTLTKKQLLKLFRNDPLKARQRSLPPTIQELDLKGALDSNMEDIGRCLRSAAASTQEQLGRGQAIPSRGCELLNSGIKWRQLPPSLGGDVPFWKWLNWRWVRYVSQKSIGRHQVAVRANEFARRMLTSSWSTRELTIVHPTQSWAWSALVDTEWADTVQVARALDVRVETWWELRQRLPRNVPVRNDT
jgi:hypothetical protein